MDALRRQVAIAYRRLTIERFLGTLVWCWFGTFVIAAIAIAVPKLMVVPFDTLIWNISWLGGSLLIGLLIAGVVTYITRRSRLDAALEIDRRFGLKERVSSTLSMDESELQSEAGRALIKDTLRRVERLDVGSKFTLQPSRRALLPLLPAALALGLLFVADPTRQEQADANTADDAVIAKQIKDSTEPLRKKMEERQKEAAAKGLADASDLFKKLEEGSRELTKKDNLDRKQALTKLNDLAKELEQRREKLGGEEKLRQQLNNMKTTKSGPADKVAQAVKDGDFKKAVEEIEKLKNELDNGNLDAKKKQELQDQLADMQKAMQKAANANDKAAEDLKKQLADAQKQAPSPEELKKQMDELNKAGNQAGAEKLKEQAEQLAQNIDKLQQQLDKLGQQQPQMDQLKQMADKLGECAKCMNEGNPQQAKAALGDLQKQLGELKKQGQELEMIDQALDQIAECKGDCNGEGKGNKDGKGQGKGQGKGKGQGQGKDGGNLASRGKGGGAGQAGDGEGAAQGGSGKRSIKPNDVGFRDSQVDQNVGKGGSVITGDAEGPNIKGLVQQEIRDQVEAAKVETSDSVTGQRLPRNQRDHAKQYFDSLREGK